MWMSETRAWTAWAMIWLTSLMTGAAEGSSAFSLRPAPMSMELPRSIDASMVLSMVRSMDVSTERSCVSLSIDAFVSLKALSMYSLILPLAPSASSIFPPRRNWRSSIRLMSIGSWTSTLMVLPSLPSGSTRYRLTMSCGISGKSSRSITLGSSRSTNSRPYCVASALATSFSVT